ncbi:hypothetical protein FCH28_18385 [Streptomyces piniterrae]|uniref:Protein kinase domain-containing protein n=1 Tax=Streptomyces piniterrae TaxID=2571125 RepID=A0A4U0NG18_9ACTN|nr:serine/threonine-protein kinase [Streptomyces piniterrae]TJZ53101.1 hypothetical protein FCH28_18385 [Streptomyces piniterrae]
MKTLGTGDPLRLGPYRLLGVLGEGGMGKVYVGQDAEGTVAAVKVLRSELTGETNLVQRFVREAQAAQAVTGKGVARVLGAQTEGGRPWIATEFLAGPTLDEAVEAYGPFDEPGLRALAAAIARTLADIHATGLIHRDLKPPNIVLTSDGPRVIDFGIARPEHGLTLTTTGQVPVTPGYGAPEQVLGRRVAAPADVFSLGAVLVYAASGRRAFDGTHIAALQYKVVHDEPDLDGVPEALRPLIAPCLAKDPAARPTPAQIVAAFAPPRGAERAWRRGQVAAAIKERESGVHELTTLTGPVTPGAEGRLTRRRLLTGLAAGGVVLAAGGGAAVALWPRTPAPPPGKTNPFAFPPAVKTPEAHVLNANDGDFIVGGSPKELWGPVEALADDSPAPLPVRDVIVFGAWGGGIAAHNVVDGKRRWAVKDIRGKGRYLSLSDRLVAAVDTKGTLRTFVASTGEPRWTAHADADCLLAADDDSVYLLTKDRRLRAVGRSDAKIRWTVPVAKEFRGRISPPGVAAHGRLILGTEDGNVLAVDTADGHHVWDVRKQWDAPIRPAVHGTTVYLHGRTLTARRIGDGKELWTVEAKDPAWHKHEDWGPATAYDDGTLYATHGNWARKIKGSDGSKIFECRGTADLDRPVLVQGNGVWFIDEDIWNQVTAVDQRTGYIVWEYKLPEVDRRWLVADGNRVFIMNGRSLYALPVF